MPQITGPITAQTFQVYISTDNSTWTDISGSATAVKADGGDRKMGEAYTFTGETPLLAPGKREPQNFKVTTVYTEGASDVFAVLRGLYESAALCYFRYAPKGGQTGEFLFSGAGYVMNAGLPDADAGSSDIVTCEFTFRTVGLTKTTAP